jgi:hypothetical protein
MLQKKSFSTKILAKTLQDIFNGVGNLVKRDGEAEVNIAFKPPLTLNTV